MRKRYIVLIVAAFIVAIILTRPKWNVESELREGDEKANGFGTSMETYESVPDLDVEYESQKWSSWLKASEDFEL